LWRSLRHSSCLLPYWDLLNKNSGCSHGLVMRRKVISLMLKQETTLLRITATGDVTCTDIIQQHGTDWLTDLLAYELYQCSQTSPSKHSALLGCALRRWISDSDVVKARGLFETSGTTYPATQRHIVEDRNPRFYRCENLKTCTARQILFEFRHVIPVKVSFSNYFSSWIFAAVLWMHSH
jgi:hypothetical protein